MIIPNIKLQSPEKGEITCIKIKDQNIVFKGSDGLFEIPYIDIIDQILIEDFVSRLSKRVFYLKGLQSFYEEKGEDDTEDYDSIIDERGILEDIIPLIPQNLKIKVEKIGYVKFIFGDLKISCSIKSLLIPIIESLCSNFNCKVEIEGLE